MEKNLWNMELHETISFPFGIYVMRVPGGWIYDCWDKEKDCFKQGNFIPYNNDLQPIQEFNPNDLPI